MTDLLARDLRKFIQENFLFGMDGSFSDQESLTETGIVDSTGILELIAHLESTYGITLEDHELVPENLDSIEKLTRFLASKQVRGPAERVSATAGVTGETDSPST